MGADDGAVGEGGVEVCFGAGGGALGDAPAGSGVLLRLDGAEPGYDVVGAVELRSGEVLGVESLAGDVDGNVYNVNADTVAETLAIALKAMKLLFLTGAPGVLRDKDDPSSLVTFADPDDLAELLKNGAIQGGMRPKVEACIRAATNGVERTHIIDGRLHDSLLLEVFTGTGAGTMIVGRKEKATYLGVDLADGDRAS